MSDAATTPDPVPAAGPYVRKRFLTLLDKIENRRTGALTGEDVTHLHELRKATRRTRSALSAIRGVLPREEVRRFKDGFRWLQRSTGAKRDLDVLRITWDGLKEPLEPADLAAAEAFEDALEHHGKRLQAEVAEALLSDTYEALVGGWRTLLTAETAPPLESAPSFGAPLRDVARASVWREWRRLRRRGRHIDATTPTAKVHEARIAGKRLRYVLAFFAGPLAMPGLDDEIEALNRMQDVLGELNDLAHQRAVIGPGLGVAADLPPEHPANDVLRDIAAAIAERYAEVRRCAPAEIAAFVTPERHARFRELFKS